MPASSSPPSNPAAQPLSLGVIVLAAGSSRRMGRPKLLLPWAETSVLGHLLAQWRALGATQIAIVCAADAQPVQAELARLAFPLENRIFNPAPNEGMFSSVLCAARWPGWQKDLTHWAIVLGDQPHLRLETLSQLLEFAAAHAESVCQPCRVGRRRHPVLLPKADFLQLKKTPASNLKDFLLRCSVAACEMNDPGLDLDIDQPGDYEAALKLAFGSR
jgi:molybdenum cofactor cytidylyltransferase